MATRADVQQVIDGFTAAWAHPDLERFMALLHPEVRLLQPVVKPIVGATAARTEFARLLDWIPSLRGTVDHHAIDESTALIAGRLVFPLGREPYELRIIDRLVVGDGLIREREAYSDSLGLMMTLLARPSAWLGYWLPRLFPRLNARATGPAAAGAAAAASAPVPARVRPAAAARLRRLEPAATSAGSRGGSDGRGDRGACGLSVGGAADGRPARRSWSDAWRRRGTRRRGRTGARWTRRSSGEG